MRAAMRHDGRPGAVGSIGDRRVDRLHVHGLTAPLLFLLFASISMSGRTLMHLAEGVLPLSQAIGWSALAAPHSLLEPSGAFAGSNERDATHVSAPVSVMLLLPGWSRRVAGR